MAVLDQHFELETLGAILDAIVSVKLLLLLECLQLGVLSLIAIPRSLHALIEQLLRVLELLQIGVQNQINVFFLQSRGDCLQAIVDVSVSRLRPWRPRRDLQRGRLLLGGLTGFFSVALALLGVGQRDLAELALLALGPLLHDLG